MKLREIPGKANRALELAMFYAIAENKKLTRSVHTHKKKKTRKQVYR